jgi:signal transduction histidine kinase
MNKLFKLFGFLDSTKEMNTKGIGLGLFICKRLVESFGGEMQAISEYGQGSCFSFTFQLSERQLT